MRLLLRPRRCPIEAPHLSGDIQLDRAPPLRLQKALAFEKIDAQADFVQRRQRLHRADDHESRQAARRRDERIGCRDRADDRVLAEDTLLELELERRQQAAGVRAESKSGSRRARACAMRASTFSASSAAWRTSALWATASRVASSIGNAGPVGGGRPIGLPPGARREEPPQRERSASQGERRRWTAIRAGPRGIRQGPRPTLNREARARSCGVALER